MASKIPVHLNDEQKKALDEFCKKTGAKHSHVIRQALTEYIIEKASTTIPKESAIVEVQQIEKDYRLAGKAMKMVLSSGFSGWNYRQALEKIDNMPLTDEKKEPLREFASYYNNFKSDKGGKLAQLVPVAFPKYKLKKKELTVIEQRWKSDKCKGCPNLEKHDKKFCYTMCKSFRKERDTRRESEK
jgi:predicted DNA-binding protein